MKRDTDCGRRRANLKSGLYRLQPPHHTLSSKGRLDDICHHFKGRADVIILQGTTTKDWTNEGRLVTVKCRGFGSVQWGWNRRSEGSNKSCGVLILFCGKRFNPGQRALRGLCNVPGQRHGDETRREGSSAGHQVNSSSRPPLGDWQCTSRQRRKWSKAETRYRRRNHDRT